MRYEWEQQAKRNEPMPEGLPIADQAAYQALAALVARYKLGAVNAEQAKKERTEIDKAYGYRAAGDRLNGWTVSLRKRIEAAHAKFRKEPTVENAMYLSDVLDGFERSNRSQ